MSSPCSLCAEDIEVGQEEYFEGVCNKCGDVRVHRECAIKHGEETILRLKCNTTTVKRMQASGAAVGRWWAPCCIENTNASASAGAARGS